MTRYKLPEALGGGEYEAVAHYRTHGDVTAHEFDIPGVGLVKIPVSALTEVKPPIPAEPEPGAYDIGGRLVVRFRPGRRIYPAPWRWEDSDDEDGWDFGDWNDVWKTLGGPDVTIRRLVLEPEPVELPWSLGTPYGDVFIKKTARPGDIYVGADNVLTAEQAEAMAAALLTAARSS